MTTCCRLIMLANNTFLSWLLSHWQRISKPSKFFFWTRLSLIFRFPAMSLIKFLFLTKNQTKPTKTSTICWNCTFFSSSQVLNSVPLKCSSPIISIYLYISSNHKSYNLSLIPIEQIEVEKPAGKDEWSYKYSEVECTTPNMMMMKNAQRNKRIITRTRWLREKETHRRHWALLTFKFYIENIAFYFSGHYKELFSWFRTKPPNTSWHTITMLWPVCALGRAVHQMYLCVSALVTTDRKKTCCVCTFTEWGLSNCSQL